jgi:transposase
VIGLSRLLQLASRAGRRRLHFKVSDSFAVKLLQRVTRQGSALPYRQGRRPGSGKLSAYRTFLIRAVEAEPDMTMPELASRLVREHGVQVAPATLSRFLRRQGFSYKKSADGIGARTGCEPGRTAHLD